MLSGLPISLSCGLSRPRDTTGDFIDVLFGNGDQLSALQMALRAAVASVLTLAMIRVAGRRSLGQQRPFDACISVLLGLVLSRAVVGASPFWPTMAAGAALVLLHRLDGEPSLALVRDLDFRRQARTG